MNSWNRAELLDLEFASESTGAIALSPEQMSQAAQRSAAVPAADQWQAYLDAIAALAFEQWIQQRSLNLSLQPRAASEECTIGVGPFRVYLAATGTLSDRIIPVPASMIDRQGHPAHFYVAVEIIEDLEQAEIQGFLNYTQLAEHLNRSDLDATEAGIYELPFNWFEPQPESLLLYLSCLEVSAIPLPEAPSSVAISSQEETARTPTLLNVRLWLEDQLDEYAQRLGWVLLPAIGLEPIALRSLAESPAAEMTQLLAQLRSQGLEIPPQARGAYREDMLSDSSIRLYVFTWLLCDPEEDNDEWSLLAIVGPLPDHSLPLGLILQIADRDQPLVERSLNPDGEESYLYGCVVGKGDESFQVSCILAQGERLEYPAFAFGETGP